MKYLIILALLALLVILLAIPAADAFDYSQTRQQNWSNYLKANEVNAKTQQRTNSWDAADRHKQYRLPFAPPPQRIKTNCSYVFGQLRCN